MATGYVANFTSVYYGPSTSTYPSNGSSVGPNETVDILWREGSWYYIEYQAGSYRKRMYILASAVSNITGTYSYYSNPTRSTRFVGKGASTYNGPGSSGYDTAGSVGNYEQVTLFTEKIENSYGLIEYSIGGNQKKRAWFPIGNLGVALGVDTIAPLSNQNLAHAIKSAGYSFVGRYYTERPSWKLTSTELDYLHNAGLSVCTFYEDADANKASYFTYAEGVADATIAYEQAKNLGQPGGTCIYFAVDFDATTSQISGCITNYFNGVISTMSALGNEYGRVYDVGVYGGRLVCENLNLAGIKSRMMAWGWQHNQSYYGWDNMQICVNGSYEVTISNEQFNVDVSKSNNGYGWAP